MKTILLLAITGLVASMKRYDGCKVLRVLPNDESDVAWIQNLESQSKVQIWNSLRQFGNPVDVMVTPEFEDEIVSLFATRGLKHTIMIRDVQATISGQTVSPGRSGGRIQTLSGFKYDEYHTYDEIKGWIDDMAAEHSIVQKFTMTKSYENRDINGIVITNDPTGINNKPIVWFEGGIHAREWISPATVMFISKSLVEDYNAGDARVVKILDVFDFHIVPSLNVDGFVYTHTADRLWRKTRSRMPNFGCVGTDPNRNWPYGWGGSGASPWPCSNVFRGSNPLSEVEIKGVVTYLTNLKKTGREIKMFIDWHSYSQLWLAPWSYASKAPLPADWMDQDNLAAAAVNAIEKVNGKVYQKGGSAITLYEAAGASCDWAYATLGAKYSYVVELRDTGDFGFLLPADQILPTGREAYQGILAGLEYALEN